MMLRRSTSFQKPVAPVVSAARVLLFAEQIFGEALLMKHLAKDLGSEVGDALDRDDWVEKNSSYTASLMNVGGWR